MARQLVELGFRGSGEVLKREEFEARKAAAEASRLSERTQQKVPLQDSKGQTLSSAGKELKDNFLKALAEREEANCNGKMAFCFFQSIIFIRDRNSRGQEVSAYIDYAHRLKIDEFEIYFNGKKKLFPRRTDLSFYNWDRNVSTSNASPNYQVIAENACGLLFKNKCDRKIVNVDPKAYPGDSTTRTPIETDLYLQVVIYDHILRRKT
ncbi:cilia- and flagella-associated protein 299 isoform X2 [Dermochelys coriacea]|uniref:cilia- and flagella-associated protein 299 isoform X2 n=1 Tax=Dermochelys coriacea TaxID=27794 RepID=UPI001CA9BFAA|nr:cilia- and flagella-associated protein 299 isoform X2 [Dermochelys coriacea]XP_043369151.1 cilia- and flagella-associated protein 299 isoform X2 [Dermochelys coriacea]XP_043369152.1 cilia- and flagella-associated protein 299 isoform X2 [Dermochelys coriacea]